MAQAIFLNEQIEPGLEFVRLFDRAMPVKVAFWLKEAEQDQPYLYVASDAVPAASFDHTYGAVIRVADQVGGYGIDPFDVKVIAGDDRMAQEALSLRVDRPGRRSRHLGSRPLGGAFAEDLYVYPPLSRVAAAAVEATSA